MVEWFKKMCGIREKSFIWIRNWWFGGWYKMNNLFFVYVIMLLILLSISGGVIVSENCNDIFGVY